MIYLFWPGKPVPEWLEEVRFTKPQELVNPYVAHNGFGVVALRNNKYLATTLVGSFMIVARCNDVIIHGGKEGVWFYSSFFKWLRIVFSAKGQP